MVIFTINHIERSINLLGQTLLMETSEQHTTNENESLVKETHTHKEEVIINNLDDPLSTVTEKLEDIHVTVTEQAPTHGLST